MRRSPSRDLTRTLVATLLATSAATALSCTHPSPPEPVVTETPASAPARPSAPPRTTPRPPTVPAQPTSRRNVRDVGEQAIRVLLASATSPVTVSSPTGLMFSDRSGSFVARSGAAETWKVERVRRQVRLIRANGSATGWIDASVTARAINNGLLSEAGKPYRGDMAFVAGENGLQVINVLPIDDYVRGVVPLEIGTRAETDSAAVQAQAVTARSYAFIHLSTEPGRTYDVTGGTQDQVYGGVAAETPVASEAVESTQAMVLKYNGRVVNAPYHSTCGGQTAAASEIWRTADEPYLQRVSDEIPGTGRYYCDISPRFRWTRTIDATALNAALAQYLATYTSVPGKKPGTAQDVSVASHTASGRVGSILISTDRGSFTVRGNDMRYVLRPPGGEILNSTFFSLMASPASDGSIEKLVINGMGYGHGVGMCQWGAIGRARAGQDFRTILHTYYPGTTIGPIE